MIFKRPDVSRRREPDLTSLINIVFLILIFFIVAGTLRPFSARDIELAKSPPDGTSGVVSANIIAFADGALSHRGQSVSLEELVARIRSERPASESAPLTIVADARLNAKRLLEIVRAVRGPGIAEISVVTEKLRE